MGLMGLLMAHYVGLWGILSGLAKSTDHLRTESGSRTEDVRTLRHLVVKISERLGLQSKQDFRVPARNLKDPNAKTQTKGS